MDFYNKINSLLQDGQIDEVFQLIQSIPENSTNQEIIKTNYFCLTSIANEYQIQKAVRLLQQCVNQKQITRITSLFTKCNIAFGHRKMQQPDQQFSLLKQILNDHFGQYFILKNLAQKSQKQMLLYRDYIFLLNQSLERLVEICIKNNWSEQQERFEKACLKMKKHQKQMKEQIIKNQTSVSNRQNVKQNNNSKKQDIQKKISMNESSKYKTNTENCGILVQKCTNVQILS